jgi:hypothetical protein
MRILKGLRGRYAQVRETKELLAHNFGQNPVKRGVCPEVRILKGLRASFLLLKRKTPAIRWRYLLLAPTAAKSPLTHLIGYEKGTPESIAI